MDEQILYSERLTGKWTTALFAALTVGFALLAY